METKKDRLIQLFNESGIVIDQNDLDRELDMDSLNFISLLVAIEKEFGIDLDDNDEFFSLGSTNPSFSIIFKYIDSITG